MDVVATLIEITAFNPIAGVVQTMRVTNRNDPRATTANGNSWLPILQTAPSVGVSVFDGAFAAIGRLNLGTFTITLADGLGDALTELAWAGADVKIYAGDMALGVYPLIYRAVGDGANRKGRLELEIGLTTRSSLLDVSLLTQSYAGTGGLEGDAGLKGVVKPWALGAARFCRAVLLDPVRQVYQVSAYGPIEATTDVFEGGQPITFAGDFAGTVTDFVTGAGPAQGTWSRYNQYGLFRLGSQPLYEVTAHVKGDSNTIVGGAALTKLGDLIGRIIAGTTTMPVKATSLAQLNAAELAPFDEYYEQQQTVSDALAILLLSVGGYYTFDENGSLIFGRVRFGASIMTLDGLNTREPAVLGINQLPTSAPVWSLRLGAEQCHFVHAASDVPAILKDQADAIEEAQATADNKNKTFPAATVPPVGAIDGDLWPDTSVSPTTTRRYNSTTSTWVAVANQVTTANQITYTAGGQTVEALKPAEGGANVTATNISAGFFGQGALASQSLAYASQLGLGSSANLIIDNEFDDPAAWAYAAGSTPTSTHAGLTVLGARRGVTVGGTSTAPVQMADPTKFTVDANRTYTFTLSTFQATGSTQQLRLRVNWWDRDGVIITQPVFNGLDFRTAAAAVDSPALISTGPVVAPANAATCTISVLRQLSGTLAAGPDAVIAKPAGRLGVVLGDSAITRADGTTTLTDGLVVTSLGSAASFFGQGAFATVNTAGYGSSLLTGFAALAAQARILLGGGFVFQADGTTSLTDALAVTSLGSAASIFGQGAFATINSAGYGSSFLTGFGALSPLSNLFFGSPLLLESSGGAIATSANFKTSLGIAASIFGQGAFATVNSAGYGSSLLTGFGALAPLGAVNFGSPLLLETAGGAQATLAAFKTASGIAASVAGQGAFATLNSAGYGSALLTGFGALSPLGSINFGSAYLLETSGGAQATLAAFKTSSGIAASIAGQGTFATTSSAAYGSPLLTGFGALAPLGAVNFGSAFLLETAGGAQATLSAFKTSSGTAAGITGQGALATQSAVTPGQTTSFGTSVNAVLDPTFTDALYWSGLQASVFNPINVALNVQRSHRVTGDGTNPGASIGVVAATPSIPCTPGERIECGASVVVNGSVDATGVAYVAISFKLRAGSTTDLAVGTASNTAGTVTNVVNRFTVPNNCVAYQLQLIASWGAGVVRTGDYAFGKPFIQPLSSLGNNVESSAGALLGDADAITAQGSAASIFGQGAFATVNTAGYGSGLLTGFGAVAAQSSLLLGNSGYLFAQNGTTPLNNANTITSNGTAAGIAGQGAFATVGQITSGNSGTLMASSSVTQTLLSATAVRFGTNVVQSNGTTSVTDAAAITSLGVASAITNQSTWATYGGLVPSTVASQVQHLDTAGGLESSFIYKQGVAYLDTRWPQEGGANVTETRTASAITAQSAWATTTTPVSYVTSQAPNLVYNGGLSLGNDGLAVGAGWTVVTGNSGEGAFAQSTTGGTQGITFDLPFGVAVGGTYCMQAELFAGGLTAGNLVMDLAYYNGAGTGVGFSSRLTATLGSGWAPYSLAVTVPAGVATAKLRVYLEGATNTNVAIKRAKVALATAASVFSDEATYGSRYRDGTPGEALKPAQVGANVTGTNTAAGIAGQGALATKSTATYGTSDVTGFAALATRSKVSLNDGYMFAANGSTALTNATVITAQGTASGIAGQTSWATYGGLVPANVAGQVQKLDSTGTLESTNVYKQNVGQLGSFWPQEAGANVTEARTASGFAGQGTLATVSSISRTNFASYFTSNAVSLNYSVTRADGTSVVTENLAITSLGISSGFSGQGTLATLNQATNTNLAYGAIGRMSIYSHESPFNLNDPSGLTPATTAFRSFAGTGITPADGNPAVGWFGFVSETISGTDSDIYVKVIRVSDGTTIWGGPNGIKMKATGNFFNMFFDNTAPGTRQQYDMQAKCPGGNCVQFRARTIVPMEWGRAAIEEIQLVASAGTGPGAGSGAGTGGNINGDTSTSVPTTPNSTANPAPTRGGLNRYVQQP